MSKGESRVQGNTRQILVYWGTDRNYLTSIPSIAQELGVDYAKKGKPPMRRPPAGESISDSQASDMIQLTEW